MRKILLALTAAMLVLPSAPALARHGHGHGHDRHRVVKVVKYDRYGRYAEPRRLNRSDRVWRGRDGRYYCHRDNGTTGLIIGGALGALAGRAVDTNGDRTLGTIIGAAGGALLGKEIDSGGLKCR